MRRENPALIRFFVRHPVASNLVMVMMIVFGLVGFTQINTQFFPTIERPTVVATFTWSGASAEDVEASILEAVEPELRFTDGLDDMESYAREGSGTVIMEFEDGHDMQKAQSDVEAVVSRITIFPDDMDDPVVSRTIVYETVAQISLSGPFPEGALRAFAQDIRDGLLDAGLDRVSLSGFRDEEILIEVPERELRRLDLNISQIGERIRVSTRDLPSGTLDGAIEKQVRALASSETLEAFRNVEVIARATGEKIRLRDIATVTTQFDPDQSINLEDGRQAIILNVQRSEAADTLESSRLVQDFVEAIKPTLPPTLTLSMSDVRAERLSERIMLLVENGGSGLLLVLLILFIFLNARIAFWVAFGIPVAFFATLGLMWVSGQTINMISLFGLIMTLGIVVDDAIVVGENTATRFAMGDSPIMAAENGAGAVTWPVVAAILTTQVAFFPLLLVDGRIGQIMGALPYVVIAVLFASLVECLLILPGHLRHAMPKNPKRPGWFRRNFDAGFIWFRDKPFGYLAKTAYHWRYTTIALAFGSLFIAAGVIASGKVGFQFFPSPEPESITANVVFTAGTPRETAMSALQKIEAALGPVEERLLEDARAAAEAGPQVEASLPTRITNSILSLVGIAPPDIAPVVQIETELVRSVSTTLGQAGRNRGDEFARIRVQLTPSEERSVRTRDITRAWRRAVPSLAGVERLAVSGNRLGPPGRDLDIQLIDAEPE
ncbi:MAG: efflux RND transporter permease subunit, partial [Pseudomonadota bacterium]